MMKKSVNKGDSKKHLLRKSLVKEFYRGNKITFVVAVFSAFLMSLLSLSASWLMQQLIDTISGVPGALELKVLAAMTVGLVLLVVVFGMVEYVSKPRFLKKPPHHQSSHHSQDISDLRSFFPRSEFPFCR